MLKPTLVTIVALDGRNEDELLALATGAAEGHTVVVGDAERFAELGLSIEPLGSWPDRLQQQGQRVVFVAVDGQTAGLLGVVDAGVSRTRGARVEGTDAARGYGGEDA